MFHEDLAGRTGPLIGPALMKTFLIPYYRKIIDMMRDNGTGIFSVDTDGNIKAVIPAFIEAGVNVLSPFEAAAGMDIVKVREEFGSKLAIMGGIDKFVLGGTKKQIEAELEYKIPPMMKTGACMFSLDHRVIGGTSLENYRFYVGKVWEYLNSHPDG
jgi:uroporphyrinogen-III decarboxylase